MNITDEAWEAAARSAENWAALTNKKCFSTWIYNVSNTDVHNCISIKELAELAKKGFA